MADDTFVPSSDQPGSGRGGSRGSSRGPRDNREPGGFRIRLSDNELQAARALQEAFGLRSTVAVLGFSLRTLAQQLEAGQLDELVAQQKALAGSRPPGANRRDGERRPPREDGRGGEGNRAVRANPFARPSRPAPAVEPATTALEEANESAEPSLQTAEDLSSEPGAASAETPAAEADLDTDASAAPVESPEA